MWNRFHGCGCLTVRSALTTRSKRPNNSKCRGLPRLWQKLNQKISNILTSTIEVTNWIANIQVVIWTSVLCKQQTPVSLQRIQTFYASQIKRCFHRNLIETNENACVSYAKPTDFTINQICSPYTNDLERLIPKCSGLWQSRRRLFWSLGNSKKRPRETNSVNTTLQAVI